MSHPNATFGKFSNAHKLQKNSNVNTNKRPRPSQSKNSQNLTAYKTSEMIQPLQTSYFQQSFNRVEPILPQTSNDKQQVTFANFEN